MSKVNLPNDSVQRLEFCSRKLDEKNSHQPVHCTYQISATKSSLVSTYGLAFLIIGPKWQSLRTFLDNELPNVLKHADHRV